VIGFLLEALDVPRPGWPSRRRFIAQQLVRLVVEGLFFIAFVAAILGCVLLVAAATDTL